MTPTTEATDAAVQYLTFSLADGAYAIELLRVREVVEYVPPTLVPNAPKAIRGVINLRGDLVAVVDLATKFGLPATPPTKRSCIAVVDVEGWGEEMRLGIVADSVHDIVELRRDQIESPPPFGTRIRLEFLRGVGKVGSELAIILELDRVLSPEELVEAAEAVAAAPAPGAE
jgi:purine-binding chemotaxis protein CheW